MKKNILVLACSAALFHSCGAANVNRIFGSADNSTTAQLQRAQIAYDKGDFDAAEEYATQAYNATTNNGEAAELLGSIMLSKAGIDIFQIVGKLSDLSSTKTSTTTTTTSTDSCGSSTTDAATSLSTLSCKLLSLSDSDISNLGSTVALTSTYFSPVTSYYKPNDITDELRQKVNVLKFTDKGIRYLCPFVNRAKVTGPSIDSRHALATCGDKSTTSFNSAKVHIAFALLHLTETLVYQRSILIDSTSSSTSSTGGIATMSSKISAANVGTDITGFLTAINEFKGMVDAVADTGNANSQISLALDGLTVVAAAFGEAGVPDKIVSSVTGGLTKLKETASKLAAAAGNASSSSTYQAQALKGQINQKYASTVATKINSVCGTSGASCASQKTQLCSSYTSISQGVDPTTVTKPTMCQ